MSLTLDTIVNLAKRRGFIFPSSEIYGGLSGVYDYGPLGADLKQNVKSLWWKEMVRGREDMVGLDASILMHPRVWEASGHVESFTDPLVDCKACKKRFRTDEILSAYSAAHRGCKQHKLEGLHSPDDTGRSGILCNLCEGDKRVVLEPLQCPECGEKQSLTEPRQFNLMFQTRLGPVEKTGTQLFLRPETAQGIFVNFDQVLQTMRKKLPFGIAQIGKSFRNEITTKSFIFRVCEFEQMEIEYFVRPGEDERIHQDWIDTRMDWYQKYGIRKENLQLREHGKDELSHYSKRTVDIEYRFPMGWKELEGIANRTDYDLKRHTEFSGQRLSYYDPETQSHIVPYVIEPSAGVDRTMLAFLVDSYHEEEVRERKRVVLRLHPALAPVKVAVLPLLRNRPGLVEIARKLAADFRARVPAMYDDTASIGKLYRRQDEVGTPYCITVDVQSADPDDEKYDGKVTVRERDSMAQERVSLDRVVEQVTDKLRAAGVSA